MITDVEAQPEVGGENVTTGQLIRLSPQKFEELVKSLARSVHILQSVVANRSMEIQKGLRGRSIHRNKDPETTIGAREYGNPGVFEQTQMGGTEEMINDDTTATVASPEEAGRWVCQMLQNFHSLCAANGISKGSHVDSWAALRYLDWPFYCQLYTLANPRANTPVGRDHTRLPAVIRDLMEDDERRLILQKQVYVGLSRWWWCNGWTKSDPLIRQRGILDMGPWVSLIGMRLPNHVGEDDLLGPSSKDITRLLILVVLLHLPQPPVDSGEHSSNSAGTFWGDTVTVGQVLDLCYHQGVMKKPHTRDINGCRVHARELTCAIKLMNIWQRIGPPDLMAFTSVNDIRSMTLSSDLWDHIYDTRENGADANPECTADRLRCSDMSLEMLQELGKLRFEWTEFLDEHLSLDTEKLVLKIFWFGFAVKACPVFQ
ncbi:hypothetical protein P154DRAFT_200530 [Amniculicola lignicola CBS 123094]|uniref:Uncharacterized protein n=1 Tax=Amniculicola lignicola CBS 123094 TaxID=1392246 RepID=A0A6A5WEM4_9PLEO|nr:hypothetical protein P154DRAFT_200530 [Amniculicola lignicola CBS 123094]